MGLAKADSLQNRVLKYVRDHPGVTGSDMQKAFISAYSTWSISTTLGRLQKAKLIENKGPGGPWSNWYPIEQVPVDEEYSDMAQWMLDEMKKLPPYERANWLAQRLQDLCT